jgi:biopolymer transport protein ExbB
MISDWIRRITEYLSGGGIAVMGTLTVAALVLWYALGYRMFILRRGNRRSVRVLIARYEKGYRRPTKGIIDTAVVLGLRSKKEGPSRLRERLDETFSGFEDEIGRFSVLVGSIVAAAPLLGLLGTVIGMIETFDSLGDMSLFSQSGGIAGGISQALFTTQMGLAVALPGLVIGRILDRRQSLIEMELAKIKDILCTGG